MSIRARIMSMLSGVALMLGLLLVPGASPASAVSCPDTSWWGHGRITARITGTNVNIRNGPSTSCRAIGRAQPSHTVWNICYKGSWVAILDSTNGLTGWVHRDYVASAAWFPC